MKKFLVLGLFAVLGLFPVQSFAQTNCPGTDLHCATVSWAAGTGPGSPATGYNIYRSTNSGGCGNVTGAQCTKAGSVTAPTLTFLDSPLAATTTYFYVVTATNTSGESGPSTPQISFTTGADPVTVPATPTNVTVTGK